MTLLSDADKERPVSIFIDEASDMAFMDPNSDRDESFLFDLKRSLVYSLDHEAKVAMKLDILPNFVPEERLKPLSAMREQGSFVVGGYKASRYSVKVKNETCLTVYASQTLSDNPSVSAFFSLYGRVLKFGNVRKVFQSLKSKSDSRYCVYSKEYIYKNIASRGVPVKFGKNGKSMLELISIKDGQLGDKRMFLVPADYKQTSMKEQLIKAAEKRANK